MMEEIQLNFSRNKNLNRGFRDLEVWRLSIKLFIMVRSKIKDKHSISLKVLGQFEDSALSISSNIAEGYCRRYLKENIQHISFALASLGENYSQAAALTLSGDLDKEWFDNYDTLHYELENKLISLNRSYIRKLQQKEGWQNDYKLTELVKEFTNE